MLDLKGSIRVLCRVRPLIEKERDKAEGPEPIKVRWDKEVPPGPMKVWGQGGDQGQA